MKSFTIHQYYLYPIAEHKYFSRKLKNIEVDKLAKRHDIGVDEIYYESIKVKVLDK